MRPDKFDPFTALGVKLAAYENVCSYLLLDYLW